MNDKTKDLLTFIAVIIALLYTGTALFFYTFREGESGKNITLNVVGIVNATNSTLVSLQLECIKFCGKDLAYSSNEKVYECWKQCATLGKEECKK